MRRSAAGVNEAHDMVDVPAELPARVNQTAIVDDACADDRLLVPTGRDDRCAQVIRYEENTGVGSALYGGHRAALEEDGDVVVSMDAARQGAAAGGPT
jgi:hypothetical protein